MKGFWDQLKDDIKSWALDTFTIEIRPTFDMRRIVSGKSALKLFDDQFTFAFSSEFSPGLSAVAINNHGAIHNAAVRLGQDASSLEDTSPLFLRLLGEQAALSLWQRVAGGLMGHQSDAGPEALAEMSAAAGGFEQSSRYLQVGLWFVVDDQPSQVTMLFELDYVQRYVHAHQRQADERKEQAGSQSRSALRDKVRASTIVLDAVLERLPLTIGECSRLEVGQVLSLPGVDPANLSLCAETMNGSVAIGQGEMGVWKRQRALKLNTPVLESFARELADL